MNTHSRKHSHGRHPPLKEPPCWFVDSLRQLTLGQNVFKISLHFSLSKETPQTKMNAGNHLITEKTAMQEENGSITDKGLINYVELRDPVNKVLSHASVTFSQFWEKCIIPLHHFDHISYTKYPRNPRIMTSMCIHTSDNRILRVKCETQHDVIVPLLHQHTENITVLFFSLSRPQGTRRRPYYYSFLKWDYEKQWIRVTERKLGSNRFKGKRRFRERIMKLGKREAEHPPGEDSSTGRGVTGCGFLISCGRPQQSQLPLTYCPSPAEGWHSWWWAGLRSRWSLAELWDIVRVHVDGSPGVSWGPFGVDLGKGKSSKG